MKNKKYTLEEAKKAVNFCPSWMDKTIIAPNGKVLGNYKFELNPINILVYYENLKSGNYDFEAVYLRDAVWPLWMKMCLIHSICHNVNLPNFWLAESDLDNTKYDIIDSKNRSVAIFEFFNNDFPIPVEIDGEKYFFYWEQINKCQHKKGKKLSPMQERLKELRSSIIKCNIPVNTVYGCSMQKRSELAAMLSKSVSWTTEEELYNFYWFARCFFKFLFNFCMVETKLNNHFNKESVRLNHRDKGTIWLSKILFLLYGDNFNDYYTERPVSNNIRNWKQSNGGKSAFLNYQERIDQQLRTFSDNNGEILVHSKEVCEHFFDFLSSSFKLANFDKRIRSLKKTCDLIYKILHAYPINSSKKEKYNKKTKQTETLEIVKPLTSNELFDIVLHTERLIQKSIFTHAMMQQNKLRFSKLYKSFRDNKKLQGAEGTAQSSTSGRIEYRKRIFEKCLQKSGLDTGLKNKRLTKKQKEDAIWESNGRDPVSKEKIIAHAPRFDHHAAAAISSDPQKVSVLNEDTNLLKSCLSEDFSRRLVNHNKKVKKELMHKNKNNKVRRCAKKNPLS